MHQKPNISQTQKNTHTPEQEIEPIESTTVDFVEPSFEAIWQDYPQDSVWDELDYQQTHQENHDEC
ncbi:hypothetical protein [Gilliamella apis]|uniref:Uncharacterized protein n=1 Tax=Gilliamella apis TaxID=1970738 RepID=A0A242NXB2_9GAMM|nr:hypothetical protein [Gilliamella apis]OTQ53729.1 hypothetical protein B6D06_00605 [Gilliamella apis]